PLRSLSRTRRRACYGDSGGTIHVSHEKQSLDAPEAASIGRATRTSRSRERVRTSHPHYGARSSFPARPKKIFFREGTPELASPCRLFGRRNQTALAPYRAILKQRCVRFNGNRRKGCAFSIIWRLRPHPSRAGWGRGVSGNQHEDESSKQSARQCQPQQPFSGGSDEDGSACDRTTARQTREVKWNA